jgi:DNA-binding transcriptional MerR regulator
MWTRDELVDRVRQALAAEYPGAPNGRIRDVPDGRAVRYYTMNGLVDRPSGIRGRQVLYGPRHLLQLVALKRRQAEGLSLAAIQHELTGASDAELARIARVSDDLLDGDDTTADPAPGRPRFWAQPAPPRPTPEAALEQLLGAYSLGGGAILVLPRQPARADWAFIAEAARPLMKALVERGLLSHNPSPTAAADAAPDLQLLDDGSPS